MLSTLKEKYEDFQDVQASNDQTVITREEYIQERIEYLLEKLIPEAIQQGKEYVILSLTTEKAQTEACSLLEVLLKPKGYNVEYERGDTEKNELGNFITGMSGKYILRILWGAGEVKQYTGNTVPPPPPPEEPKCQVRSEAGDH